MSLMSEQCVNVRCNACNRSLVAVQCTDSECERQGGKCGIRPLLEAHILKPGQAIVPIESTDAICDSVRTFILGKEMGCTSLQSMREFFDSSGKSIEDWPQWAKKDLGHITKSGQADIMWHMMVAAAIKGVANGDHIHKPEIKKEIAEHKEKTGGQS